MNQKLSWGAVVFIGTMLFGMFFGAGNLIFPVHLGQEAGNALWPATLGFLATAIGLPFLGIVAMGVSRSNGLQDLVSRVHPTYGKIFTLLLYITIGPAFAIPRTSTVSYTIGFEPFLGGMNPDLALGVFSAVFFIVAILFSLNPGKLMTYIGKVLTPLFLVFLSILLLTVVFMPMGDYNTVVPQGEYATHAFFKGFTEGYNTLDVLASLAFGIIVIRALQGVGVTEPKDIAIGLVKAGFVACSIMAVIYGFLAYSGATSVTTLGVAKNGGITMAQMNAYYFGNTGAILLAIIVTLACLKTCVGLIGACGETFDEMFPNTLGYRGYAYLTTAVGFLIANVGLTKIIELAIPVLMFLYPLSITIILLSFAAPMFKGRRAVYAWTTVFALFAALGDAMATAPEVINTSGFVQWALPYYGMLPFASIGMGWIVPSIIGFVLGLVYIAIVPNKTDSGMFAK